MYVFEMVIVGFINIKDLNNNRIKVFFSIIKLICLWNDMLGKNNS